MRKIVASLFISVDGVVESPETWHFPYFNEEMGAAVDAQISTVDTLLFGRTTYDVFATTWPGVEAAGGDAAIAAKKLGDVRKIVASRRRPELPWRNSEWLGVDVGGDFVAAVTALKNEPGGDIGVSGSVSVVRQLLAAGLLDELELLVHPIAVQSGTRLFDESGTSVPLTVLRSRTFTTGVLHVTYGPDRSAPTGGYQDASKALADAQRA